MRLPREVDKPTYEIVGEVERYDQRDSANARISLIPGSAEYEDYYSRRPELKESDDEVRQSEAAIRKTREVDPINSHLSPSTYYGSQVLGYKPVVEGKDSSQRLAQPDGADNIDSEEMARKIKGFALYLGAIKVRIGKLKQEWVFTHYPENYSEPVELDYENVICMAFPQEPTMIGGRAIEVEAGWRYSYSSLVSVTVAEFIRRCGWRARALPRNSSPYFVIPTFVDAGMGEQGRYGIVITKEFGSLFTPSAVATDMPLTLDRPVDFGLQDFCEKCKICAEVCPAGVIPSGDKQVVRGVKRWCVDTNGCRLYRGKLIGTCGLCKRVCPWNHPNNWLHDNIRELSQSFPFLRKFLIKGENIFYGRYKQSPVPNWIRIKGIVDT